MNIKKRYAHLRSCARLGLNILKCRLTRVYKPLVVLLHMTDKCNLRCKYCEGDWSGRRIKDFTTNEILRIIDECKELGACHFVIHGGEILLRDDIGRIVDYMKGKDLYVDLVTNGALLPDKINEIRNVDSLCVSLDGREENHDFIRGNGSWRAAMKAIDVARAEGIKLSVHATLTKRNFGDMKYLCEQARRMGYLQQFSLLLKPLKQFQDELVLNDEEIKTVLREIIELKRKGYPVFTSYRVLKNALNWPFAFEKSRLDKNEIPRRSRLIRCFYGKLKLMIDADGFAYPCTSLNDVFKGLNVREHGVKKAYEHVLRNNDCEACFYLTQNEWSLLLGGGMGQFLNQAKIQVKRIF